MNLDPERLNTHSLEMVDHLFRRASFSVFCKDLYSNYFKCNHRFLVDCGLESVTNIIGKCDYDLVWTKEEAAFFRLVDQEVLATGVSRPKFIEAQTDYTGKKRWIETSKYPLIGEEGSVLGVVGYYHQLD